MDIRSGLFRDVAGTPAASTAVRAASMVAVGLLLVLPGGLFALEYEFSDGGLNGASFEGGRTEYEFADIDNDGNVDILTIGDHGSPDINANEHGITVFFGDGRGRWRVRMNGHFGYGGIAVGDVNGDGDWDVGYAMHHNYARDDFGDQMIEVALGDGSGENWEPWDDGLAVPRGGDDWYGMFGTDFGDVDNDGDLDIGSVSFGSGTGLHLYRNNGDGSWEDIYYSFGRDNSTMDFCFGDINNDGALDFACSLQNHEVFFGDGEGNWDFARAGLPAPPEGFTYMSVDLGDVDGDGGDDIAFVNASYGLDVYRYDAEDEDWESLSDGLPRRAQHYTRVDLCDMDVDGDLDLVAGGPSGLEVWLQDPDGDPRWECEWRYDFQDYIGCNALRAGGDIDHNGFPDIVVLVNIRTGFMQHRNFMHVFRETSDADELWISPVDPRGGELFAAGGVRFLNWNAAVPGGAEAEVDILFSSRGADGPWELIVEGFPNGGTYQWRVPDVQSRSCFIKFRVVADRDTAEALTPEPFSIIGGNPMPVLEVEPQRVEFAGVEVDQRAESPLTVRNVGFGELVVQPLRLAVGDVFTLEGGDREFRLNVDEEREVTVVFEPSEDDLWLDTVLVASNGGEAAVPLVGRTAGVEGPRVEVSSRSIDFGRVHVDSTRDSTLVVFNRGDRDAVVTIPPSPDRSFAWEPVAGAVIEPGDSIALGIELSLIHI